MPAALVFQRLILAVVLEDILPEPVQLLASYGYSAEEPRANPFLRNLQLPFPVGISHVNKMRSRRRDDLCYKQVEATDWQ